VSSLAFFFFFFGVPVFFVSRMMFTAFTNIYTPLDAMTFFSSFSFLSLSHGFGGYHTSVGLDVGLRNSQPFLCERGRGRGKKTTSHSDYVRENHNGPLGGKDWSLTPSPFYKPRRLWRPIQTIHLAGGQGKKSDREIAFILINYGRICFLLLLIDCSYLV